MKLEEARIKNLIIEALEELNEEREADEQLDTSGQSDLFGETGMLDSLSLVNLIVIVEEKLEEATESALTLADDRAMSQRNSPFRSIDTLTGYILSRLGEIGNDE